MNWRCQGRTEPGVRDASGAGKPCVAWVAILWQECIGTEGWADTVVLFYFAFN